MLKDTVKEAYKNTCFYVDFRKQIIKEISAELVENKEITIKRKGKTNSQRERRILTRSGAHQSK